PYPHRIYPFLIGVKYLLTPTSFYSASCYPLLCVWHQTNRECGKCQEKRRPLQPHTFGRKGLFVILPGAAYLDNIHKNLYYCTPFTALVKREIFLDAVFL